MNATIATQMFGADFLKLRKKRGTVVWALVLAIAPILIFFIVKAAQHSSSPSQHSPAGGIGGFTDALRVLALFFGPLAAIMIGTDGGAGDLSAGVFRDLVVTGRSRLALFGSRVPASLALCWIVVVAAYIVVVIGTFVFASGTPTPETALIINGLLFSLFATGVLCIVATGFSSLTGSKPAALTVLIGWQLVASPILANIGSLGSSRELLLSQAVAHFSPVSVDGGGRGGRATVTLSTGTAIIVTLVWIALFTALGAWRTRATDA